VIAAPSCNGCSRFVDQQRKLVELEAELAEWRAQERGNRDAVVTIERCARIRELLGLSAGRGRILIALIDHPGALQTKEHLLNVGTDSEDVQVKMVDVHVCGIRQALDGAGFNGAIETVWGFGYRMSPATATQLGTWLARPEDGEQEEPLSPYELAVLGSSKSAGSAAAILGRTPEWVDAQRAAIGLRRSA
jgi:DNA-binding winged helix-turn-helix (wHTH) protein